MVRTIDCTPTWQGILPMPVAGRSALEDFGYRVRTYEGFMTGAVDFHAFDGAHISPAEIKKRHDLIRDKLRERAARFDGSHVAYDPSDDEDGWLIVGTESDVRRETDTMIRESADA